MGWSGLHGHVTLDLQRSPTCPIQDPHGCGRRGADQQDQGQVRTLPQSFFGQFSTATRLKRHPLISKYTKTKPGLGALPVLVDLSHVGSALIKSFIQIYLIPQF